MKKAIKNILFSICLMMSSVLPLLTLAESDASKNLKGVGSMGDGAPYQGVTQGTNDLASIIGIVIQAFLGILGVLFLVYIVYAGYNWMTAQGDEEKVTKAKDTIQRAIIGLIIIIGAYAISYWVFDSLLFASEILK